jgi:hypothetical protein
LVEALKVRRVVAVEQFSKVQYVMLPLSMVHNHPAWSIHLHYHHHHHPD